MVVEEKLSDPGGLFGDWHKINCHGILSCYRDKHTLDTHSYSWTYWGILKHKLMFWIFNAFVYMSILTSSDVLNKRPNPWRITYYNRKPHLTTNTEAPKYKVRGKCYCGDVSLLSICLLPEESPPTGHYRKTLRYFMFQVQNLFIFYVQDNTHTNGQWRPLSICRETT